MGKLKLFLTAVLVCLSAGIAFAQTKTVKGNVTAKADGLPIIGAYVQIEGTKLGTITDLDGNFTIPNVPASATHVLVTNMGNKDVRVPIADNLRVVMEDDAEVLESAVVTGMQKVDRRLFTGSAAKIDASTAKLDGIADVSRSLEGRVAGVSV